MMPLYGTTKDQKNCLYADTDDRNRPTRPVEADSIVVKMLWTVLYPSSDSEWKKENGRPDSLKICIDCCTTLDPCYLSFDSTFKQRWNSLNQKRGVIKWGLIKTIVKGQRHEIVYFWFFHHTTSPCTLRRLPHRFWFLEN